MCPYQSASWGFPSVVYNKVTNNENSIKLYKVQQTTVLDTIVACSPPSSLWVCSSLICLVASLLEGWMWFPPGSPVSQTEPWDVTHWPDLHLKRTMSEWAAFVQFHFDSPLSCLQHLLVLLGSSQSPASWPGKLGPNLLQRFSSAQLFWSDYSLMSAYTECWRRMVTMQTSSFVLPYGMVVMGLGGWFSGKQSSVGEGRPSESSRSRWTWEGRVFVFFFSESWAFKPSTLA